MVLVHLTAILYHVGICFWQPLPFLSFIQFYDASGFRRLYVRPSLSSTPGLLASDISVLFGAVDQIEHLCATVRRIAWAGWDSLSGYAAAGLLPNVLSPVDCATDIDVMWMEAVCRSSILAEEWFEALTAIDGKCRQLLLSVVAEWHTIDDITLPGLSSAAKASADLLYRTVVQEVDELLEAFFKQLFPVVVQGRVVLCCLDGAVFEHVSQRRRVHWAPGV